MHPAQRSTKLPLTDSLCLSVTLQPAVLEFEDIGKSGKTDTRLRKLVVDCDACPTQHFVRAGWVGVLHASDQAQV